MYECHICWLYWKYNGSLYGWFFVYGTSFDNCLFNLNKVLKRCEDQHMVLNWEKCHFMVKEGIVLGNKISWKGIEVDPAKIEAIANYYSQGTSKV